MCINRRKVRVMSESTWDQGWSVKHLSLLFKLFFAKLRTFLMNLDCFLICEDNFLKNFFLPLFKIAISFVNSICLNHSHLLRQELNIHSLFHFLFRISYYVWILQYHNNQSNTYIHVWVYLGIPLVDHLLVLVDQLLPLLILLVQSIIVCLF